MKACANNQSLQKPLNSRVDALLVKEESDHKMAINIDDSDDETEGVLDGEDVDSERDEEDVEKRKVELLKELKALGVNVLTRYGTYSWLLLPAAFLVFPSISLVLLGVRSSNSVLWQTRLHQAS